MNERRINPFVGATGGETRLAMPDWMRQLTEAERKAVGMTLRARMRTEAGTFHELLRRAVEKLDPIGDENE